MNQISVDQDQQAFAEQVLASEAQAVSRVRIGPAFHEAVELIVKATSRGQGGSVVVSGLGKSGLIGQKLAATLAATGTPSHFLHPTEAMHGDLGRVRRGDVVLLLSYGGNTDEVVSLGSILRQDDVPIIALTGRVDNELSRLATVALETGEMDEPCPLNLAPTASTTAMLALGDALALTVMRRRNFGIDDFKKVHPGGTLGRQVMPVVKAMRFRVGENLPMISRHLRVEQAYAQTQALAQAGGLRRAGAVLIVDDDGKLVGIFTDGDLRRSLIKGGSDAWHEPIEKYMTTNPTTLHESDLVRDAVHLVRTHRWDEIPVVDQQGKPLGLIDVQDLVALKVIES